MDYSGALDQRKNTANRNYLHSKTGTTIKHRYLLKDHLGSTDVITDEQGVELARMRFDAFGNRTLSTAKIGDPTNKTQGFYDTQKGYTGHSMLDNLGLVHMQGRVYDPSAGRFLSADIHVQAPYFSQSFNRYSYVMNNPLSATDPTGYRTECRQVGNETICTYHNDTPSNNLDVLRDLQNQQNQQNQFGLMDQRVTLNFENDSRVWAQIEGSDYQHNVATPQGLDNFLKEANKTDKNGKGLGLDKKRGPQPHVLKNPESFIGNDTFKNANGNHECVLFLQQAAGAPYTGNWQFGDKPDANTPKGTLIATPGPDGKYGIRNAKGDFVGGHAAVLLSVEDDGSLHVVHQHNKLGKVKEEYIEDKPDHTNPYISRDASNYRVILY